MYVHVNLFDRSIYLIDDILTDTTTAVQRGHTGTPTCIQIHISGYVSIYWQKSYYYTSLVKDNGTFFLYDLCFFFCFVLILFFLFFLMLSCVFVSGSNWYRSCPRLCSQTPSIILIDRLQGIFFIDIGCFCIAWMRHLFHWKGLFFVGVL